MNVVFIGCIEFSYRTLRHALTLPDINVIGIVTKEESSFNADFHSLKPLANRRNIPCFVANANNRPECERWIQSLQPDVIFCFGWSSLLHLSILKIPRLGVIGSHPTLLPLNRGRHPLIWSLALGLKACASTFFLMDQGADSGDILIQEEIPIEDTDDAASLYEKVTQVALRQITKLSRSLVTGDIVRTPQNATKATYWRKRTKEDGRIDWRMSAQSIHNLVRALTRPYPGAHCVYQGDDIKVWKTEMSKTIDLNSEPGKVLASNLHTLAVKCGEGVLNIVEHEFPCIPKRGDHL